MGRVCMGEDLGRGGPGEQRQPNHACFCRVRPRRISPTKQHPKVHILWEMLRIAHRAEMPSGSEGKSVSRGCIGKPFKQPLHASGALSGE